MTYRPCTLSIQKHIDALSMVVFDADAPLSEPHCACAECREEWPVRLMSAIADDEVFDLYVRDYSVSYRESLFCPDCLVGIDNDYRPNDGRDDAFDRARDARLDRAR